MKIPIFSQLITGIALVCSITNCFLFPKAPQALDVVSVTQQESTYSQVYKTTYPTERKKSTIYYPDAPEGTQLPVIAFLHGYFFFDITDTYEDTLINLASEGYIVLSLNYEDIKTPTADYVDIASTQIQDGIAYAQNLSVTPAVDKNGEVLFGLMGHSAGGVTALNLASCYREKSIPKPRFIFTMSACDGGNSLVPTYDLPTVDPDTNLLMTFGEEEDDNVWHTNESSWNTLTQIPVERRQWIVLYSDANGSDKLVADHGWMTTTNSSTVDSLRRYGCWKWSVAIANDTFYSKDHSLWYGGTAEQLFMGVWGDGTPVHTARASNQNIFRS